MENTVALDGQTTTTTDNAILRYDTGNSKFEGVTISASQLVGRSATGDTRGMSAATARQQVLGVPAFATAVGTNNESLFWSSSSSSYDSKSAATARSLIGLGTAAPANNQVLAYSSSASMYQQTLIDTANIAANAVTYVKLSLSNDITQSDIATDGVGQAEIAPGVVGQGELKTTTGTVSHSENTDNTESSAIRTLPGGQYGFNPEADYDTTGSSTMYMMYILDRLNDISIANGGNVTITANSTDTGGFVNQAHLAARKDGTDGTNQITVRQRYVQASPPYDLGDGECGLFIEADVKSNGDVVGLYVAPDPVWANNGPTDIRPDWTDKKTGKKYKRVRRPALNRADLDAGRCDMADYIAAQKEAPVEDVEVTHALKNADMDVIPHSWASPPQGTICLLDPVNTFDLLMLHEAGEDVADLIHKGYIKVGDKVNRKGPPGVTPVSWKWK